MMRLWLLSAIAIVLNACSSTAPTVVHDKPIANTPVTQLRATPPQNLYKPAANSSTPATYSGVFPKAGEYLAGE